MTLIETSRSNQPATTTRTVLVDAGPPTGLVVVPRRRLDAVLARLRSGALDRRLADGVAPETSRLLATRAAMLTSRRARDTVALRWAEVAERAGRAASRFGPQVPVARSRVRAADEHIERLITALRGPGPVPAAGVAAARLLLTASGSPVYHVRHDHGDALSAALDRILAAL